MRLAEYSGIGSKTGMGFGQVRLARTGYSSRRDGHVHRGSGDSSPRRSLDDS